MARDTNEFDCWRAGEMDEDEVWCDWCGEPSDTDICATCQQRYEEDRDDGTEESDDGECRVVLGSSQAAGL